MNDRKFSLKPFPSKDPLPGIEITGNISRHSNTFSISYRLSGSLSEVMIPALAGKKIRKHGLWKETCFEIFLCLKDSEQYWEFNLSPSGHWNIYRFKSYRQGMQEEPAFTSLPFSVDRQPDVLRIILKVDLDKSLPSDQALSAGISAVVKTMDSRITYWALTHTGAQADFHLRDSFILEL